MGNLEDLETLKNRNPNRLTGVALFSLRTNKLFDFTKSVLLYKKLDYDRFCEVTFPSEEQIITTNFWKRINGSTYLCMPVTTNKIGQPRDTFLVTTMKQGNTGRGLTKQVTNVNVVPTSKYESQFPLLIRVNIEDKKYIYFLGGNNHGSCQRFNVKE